jgi:hypothetical protein
MIPGHIYTYLNRVYSNLAYFRSKKNSYLQNGKPLI